MLGRSDGVLNPAGVRFGSAELYTILDKFIPDLIEDSLAVGQNLKSNIHQLGKLTENGKKPCNLAENRIQADSFHSLADERVILFVKLSKELSSERFEELKVQLNATIRAELSPRHVPALIIPVSIIPTTMNGKKAEVVVKKLLNCNNEQSFIEALGKGLQDPDCLNEFLVLKNGLLKLT